MKNKFPKKRIVGLAAAMLCCSMILFGCGGGNNNTPKRQYDRLPRSHRQRRTGFHNRPGLRAL